VTPSPTLRRGEFFGSRVAQRQLGSFTLSLTQYDAGGELPWHEHDETYVTFVVDGSYRERISGSAWMRAHAVAGVDLTKPLMPQLDKLSDEQLRAAFRSLDPYAKAADVVR
jgi:hypothetical protein